MSDLSENLQDLNQGGVNQAPPQGLKRDRTLDEEEDDDDDRKAGRERRKIEIKFISDKSRRHITFSKRKAGIMKKAYELSVLTGTQVLLLVVSETGLVYTFTTPKLQPLVTKPEGKNLIQACLNAPEENSPPGSNQGLGDIGGPDMADDSPGATTNNNNPPVPSQAPQMAPPPQSHMSHQQQMQAAAAAAAQAQAAHAAAAAAAGQPPQGVPPPQQSPTSIRQNLNAPQQQQPGLYMTPEHAAAYNNYLGSQQQGQAQNAAQQQQQQQQQQTQAGRGYPPHIPQ